MSHTMLSRKRLKGFTLIELLVVVAIIALLISILLPSLQDAKKQAQAVACMSSLDQVLLGLRMYQDEHNGWLPYSVGKEQNDWDGSLWSEAAWNVPKENLWFYKLTPTYIGNPKVFACPGDPFLTEFDYEADPDEIESGADPYTDNMAFSCGYGMNYFLRHGSAYTNLMNAERAAPERPSDTILIAEVGPDDSLEPTPLYGNASGGGVGMPWRDGGRLIWDSGVRGWFDGPTWLTGRHLGSINMASMDLSVRRVSTTQQLAEGPQTRTTECWGLRWSPGNNTFICLLCQENWPEGHYQFYQDSLWWWTGDYPR